MKDTKNKPGVAMLLGLLTIALLIAGAVFAVAVGAGEYAEIDENHQTMQEESSLVDTTPFPMNAKR